MIPVATTTIRVNMEETAMSGQMKRFSLVSRIDLANNGGVKCSNGNVHRDWSHQWHRLRRPVQPNSEN